MALLAEIEKFSNTPAPEAERPEVSYPADGPDKPDIKEAERRQITVMFCDLVDSTRLAEARDPEE